MVNFRVVLVLIFRGFIFEINRGLVFVEFIFVKIVRCLSYVVSSYVKLLIVVWEVDL